MSKGGQFFFGVLWFFIRDGIALVCGAELFAMVLLLPLFADSLCKKDVKKNSTSRLKLFAFGETTEKCSSIAAIQFV